MSFICLVHAFHTPAEQGNSVRLLPPVARSNAQSLSFGTAPIHFARILPRLEPRFGFEIKYHIEEEGGMSQHPLHIDTPPVPTAV
jgi:hypothetical protein